MKRHKTADDRIADIPAELIAAEKRWEDEVFARDTAPVMIGLCCQECHKRTLHTDLPGGGFQCTKCGAQKVR